jgi:aspartyl-tRNA(Asn)/glutamyl-tRNA(Gln) amidotransferase subunit A
MLGTFVLSSGYYDQYYGRATQVRHHIAAQVEALYQEFDFLLGPVAPTPAFRIGEKEEDPLAMYLGDLCSVLANLTKTPAISIPGRPTTSGLPVGIQLAGPRCSDYRLLSVCQELQKRLRHFENHPV